MKHQFVPLFLAISLSATGCYENSAAPECADNHKKCENNTAYVCIEGVWDEGTACPEGCLETECAQKSTQCEEGKTYCSDNLLYTCTNGDWDYGRYCSFGCMKDKCAESPTECEENAQKCENSRAYQCTNGKWNTGTACPYGCLGTQCSQTAQCSPTETKCENNKEYKCAGGKWALKSNCTLGCNGNICATNVITCSDGATKCENDTQYICESNGWRHDLDCVDGCNGNICSINGECAEKAKKCENDMAYVCQSGSWDSGTPCELGCKNKVCRLPELCSVTDDMRCESDRLWKCQNKQWTVLEKCDLGCSDKACIHNATEGESCIDVQSGSPMDDFCIDDVTAMLCIDEKWAVQNCLKGCADNKCNPVDDTEGTECDLEKDKPKCKKGFLFTCDRVWQASACSSDELCANDADKGSGCYKTCEDLSHRISSCDTNRIIVEECRDNGSGYGYLITTETPCEHGCDGNECKDNNEE